MAVTISLILFPLISAIQKGEVVIGSYVVIPSLLIGYLIWYVLKHRKEVPRKDQKTYIGLAVLYVYVFATSIYLMVSFAPYMQNIKI